MTIRIGFGHVHSTSWANRDVLATTGALGEDTVIRKGYQLISIPYWKEVIALEAELPVMNPAFRKYYICTAELRDPNRLSH